MGESQEVGDAIANGVAALNPREVVDKVGGIVHVWCIAIPCTGLAVSAGEEVEQDILPDKQRRRVDPLPSTFPSLDGRGIEDVLPHEGAGFIELRKITIWSPERSDSLDGQLNGTFDDGPGVFRIVEVFGEKELTKEGLEFPVGLPKFRRHFSNHGLLCAIEAVGCIVHKVAVQLFTDEIRGAGASEDELHEVMSIPPATLAEDRLHAIVVIPFQILELIIEERVSRQCACALLDVVLAVASSLAEGKQFHQFPSEIFIGTVAIVLVVVEVLDHRWIADDALRQVTFEVACGMSSEQFVLLEHLVAVFDGPVPGCKVAMPEEHHFFLKRAGVIRSAVRTTTVGCRPFGVDPCAGVPAVAFGIARVIFRRLFVWPAGIDFDPLRCVAP